MRKGRRYKFNIINMMKPDSVYNQGLTPLLYSDTETQRQAKRLAEEGAAAGGRGPVGWFRAGSDIAYYANSIKRKSGSYYTLTFTVAFPHDNDQCYLAHCYPFT